MLQQIIPSVVRTLLSGVGTALVTKGIIDQTTLETGTGAVVALIGVVWAIVAGLRRHNKEQAKG